MRNSLTAFIIVSLLFITACGGTNHWDGLSGAESLVRNEVYVSKSGDDTLGDGSPQMPYASITKGISDASTRGYGIVRVAEGLYSENVSLIEGVSLYGGYDPSTWTRDVIANQTIIDGDGGADSAIISDSLASPVTQATVVDGFRLQRSVGAGPVVRITNTSPTIGNNTINANDNGIECTNNSSALISGNTIDSGNFAVSCNTSSDTIRNNNITGTTNGIFCDTYSGTISGNTITSNVFGIQCITTGGIINGNTIVSQTRGINLSQNSTVSVRFNTVTATAMGILINNSTVIIAYNTIRCTTNNPNYAITIGSTAVGYVPEVYGNLITGGTAANSYGINNEDTSTRIYNNVIIGGVTPATGSWGISLSRNAIASIPEIYNNTINGGDGTGNSYGIDILPGVTPRISNNIIFSTSASSIGVLERDGTCNPLEFRNNNIFDCVTLYVDNGTDSITTEGGLAAVGTGNLSRDLSGLIDAQGRRTAPWPIEVIGDGLNGAVQAPPWVFNIDRDRTPRTTSAVAPLSWSMGAYEYDTL